MKNYLNFEKEIKELDEELEKLKDPYNQGGISEVDTKKISLMENQLEEKLKIIYSNLLESQEYETKQMSFSRINNSTQFGNSKQRLVAKSTEFRYFTST